MEQLKQGAYGEIEITLRSSKVYTYNYNNCRAPCKRVHPDKHCHHTCLYRQAVICEREVELRSGFEV